MKINLSIHCKTLLSIFLVCYHLSLLAQQNIIVKAQQPIATITSHMWGIFFEDINLGADGGLYAELIKNRSFEFQKPLMGWSIQQKKPVEGTVLVLNRKNTHTANPRYLAIKANQFSKGDFVMTNEGFRGMGIKEGLRYDFSMLYHLEKAGIKLHLQLIDTQKNLLASTTIEPAATQNQWQSLKASFTANKTFAKAKFQLLIEGSGVIELDMVSLFPADTWKGRPGGLRADMVEALAALKPGFIRFPGGCIVEGIDLNNRYKWKNTIGPLEERQLIMNRWNVEFAHRPAPDYFQTFGLGFYEYFQLAEDIGAAALPILNCGMACQYNTAELVPLDQLEPYIQDALDLIEFANGAVTSTWGSVRAKMGHPAPFNLQMLGVGNENWGPQYLERAKIFKQRIKAVYPSIQLIFSGGTDPSGERFELLNTELRKMQVDFIDEHYYRTPDWFLANAKRYDAYPRTNTKVFAGEYAAQSDKMVSVNNKNNWFAALSEAAFMTGLERNAAVVGMASYAPLFAHVDGWQWTPDLIWVNNLQVNKTPNYYVQQMFSAHKVQKVVPILLNNAPVAGQDSLYATAALDTIHQQLVVKLVNVSTKHVAINMQLEGKMKWLNQLEQTSLASTAQKVNTFNAADNLVPVVTQISMQKNTLPLSLPPYAFYVLKIGYK